jgi:hypothetical protein
MARHSGTPLFFDQAGIIKAGSCPPHRVEGGNGDFKRSLARKETFLSVYPL